MSGKGLSSNVNPVISCTGNDDCSPCKNGVQDHYYYNTSEWNWGGFKLIEAFTSSVKMKKMSRNRTPGR